MKKALQIKPCGLHEVYQTRRPDRARARLSATVRSIRSRSSASSTCAAIAAACARSAGDVVLAGGAVADELSGAAPPRGPAGEATSGAADPVRDRLRLGGQLERPHGVGRVAVDGPVERDPRGPRIAGD